MADNARALVAQMRESLSGAVGWLESEGLDLGSGGEGFNQAIAAADQWLESPPTNQCGETCERAKLCATCARGLEQPEQEPLTDPTDRDVDRLQAQVAELTAEVEIARKDALRYRWLRNESWAGYNQRGGLPQVWTTDGAGNRKTMLAEDAMDEAIDRARGC